MTLFKQIALMLSIFLVVILATVLTLNFQSANTSVQDRLYEDAKNTASSLSLSLGSANGDISMMSTMINANFDSGNYLIISLVDVDDALLYERTAESEFSDVPDWFLKNVTIEAPIASANVSAGWSQVGILNVQSDVAFAYKQLYTILINLLISFGLITISALVILYIILAAILKPLKEVQKQAEAVGRNEFILQKHIPYTKEFKDVVLGMNNMVSKVKAMFDKGNEELKRQKELEYIDPTTKLRNRKYLIDKLPEFLKIDANSKGGVNIMTSLSGLIEANEQIGHRDVDQLFIDIAEIFKENSSDYKNAIIARMNGTEFSLFLPDCPSENALQIAETISKSVTETIKGYKLDTKVVYIALGAYEYSYKQNIGQLLSSSDNALAQAKFKDYKIHLEKVQEDEESMGKDDWRAIINEAIENNNFKLVSWTAVDSKAKKIAHHALSLNLQAGDKTYYYGQFMAPANQIGLSSKIYQNVMQMIFKHPDASLNSMVCSIRLSFEYMDMRETYTELAQLLKLYANKLPFKLIVEIPDKMFRQNSTQIKEYKALFQKYSIDMGIYEFIGESSDYQYLQDLRPVYIKGETSYFLSQSDQALSALRLITDTVGISLIASGVMDTETLEKLQAKDVYIIQGRAT
ncbi:MAG: diguanylate cyclase, partial [Helicobacteraceae bacterium]|nr:diguanylate cyclase [Candidatus Sulfurimonas ponti]